MYCPGSTEAVRPLLLPCDQSLSFVPKVSVNDLVGEGVEVVCSDDVCKEGHPIMAKIRINIATSTAPTVGRRCQVFERGNAGILTLLVFTAGVP